MTGTQLLASAAAVIHDAHPSDYDGFAVSWINILLAETFDINNRLRVAAGSAVLATIPQLSALTETLTYENKLVFNALPYGLAVKLIADDRDSNFWNMLHAEYVNRINEMDVGFVEAVPFSTYIDDDDLTQPLIGFDFRPFETVEAVV